MVLEGSRFFVRMVKMMRAFINETTTRVFGTVCLGVRQATLCGVRTDMLFAPYSHHVAS
jgi:hypothetical protein